VNTVGASDTGRRRTENQDSILLWDFSQGTELEAGSVHRGQNLLVAVCDGMGGEGGGELASRITAETILAHAREQFPSTFLTDADGSDQWLGTGVAEANLAVLAGQKKAPELKTMGSTATVVGLLAGQMVWAHVGDSRAYHLRGGRLRQLTVDHSFVGRLVATGQITPEEARVHENRNLLTQAVGTAPSLELDTGSIPLQAGDRVLVCSDGLYDMVPEDSMLSVLDEDASADAQCLKLVNLANENGGFDNISVIVAHITSEE
jgi:protein phosphatase